MNEFLLLEKKDQHLNIEEEYFLLRMRMGLLN